MSADFWIILSWWAVLFFLGAAAYPLTRTLFSSWWDRGYLFSKAIGIGVVTLFTWYLGSFKILPFTTTTIILSILAMAGGGLLLLRLYGKKEFSVPSSKVWIRIILLELLFFICLWYWSYIKAFEPDIRGLEKFMDYGFAKTIQNSLYFPPPDMWYAGGTINYYYFGHLIMALLSKLTAIDLSFGYNLTLSTLFALCFSMSFGIGVQLFQLGFFSKDGKKSTLRYPRLWAGITGLVSAFLVTLAGNMQTIYAFTKGYSGDDNPPPFWKILWPVDNFFTNLAQGINTYWYANATRFIPFTIHEFPSYSFVVSDNHGHVIGIPFVLLAVAGLISLFIRKKETKHHEMTTARALVGSLVPYALYGVLVGMLFMTNALDGPIYMGLFAILAMSQVSRYAVFSWEWCKEKGIILMAAVSAFLLTTFPFLLNFTSFATGLAVNCPPAFLANTKIGPILFEEIEKCQRSPVWMMWLLWGFFVFTGLTLVIISLQKRHHAKLAENTQSSSLHQFLRIIFFYSLGLIIFAEFFYFKDIYPAHFRSNTMFKLGYQAFILCSLLSGYVIVRIVHLHHILAGKATRIFQLVFFLLLLPQLFLVSIFPLFSVRSYFGGLTNYKGLYGFTWFANEYPDDFNAMTWLSAKAKQKAFIPQPSSSGGMTFLARLATTDVHVHDTFFTSHLRTIPTIVEADGDSYTDYNRLSSFAGMPTIVGWGVHEWLWRGTYDVVSPRKEEVRVVYEGEDQAMRFSVLTKYNVKYIVVGTLERQKFSALREDLISEVAQEAYRSGDTVIYAR